MSHNIPQHVAQEMPEILYNKENVNPNIGKTGSSTRVGATRLRQPAVTASRVLIHRTGEELFEIGGAEPYVRTERDEAEDVTRMGLEVDSCAAESGEIEKYY